MNHKAPYVHSLGALFLGATLLLTACSGDGEPSDTAQSPTVSETATAEPTKTISPVPSISSSTTSSSTTSSSTTSSSPTASSPATDSSHESEPSPTAVPPTAAAESPSAMAQDQSADSLQVLVNKRNPLDPLEYAPADLQDIGHGHLMRSAAATAYQSLIADASAAGLSIVPTSSYRSYSSQVETHNYWRNQYGQEYAERISARAGYSEHQTGLAVDVMPASGQCRLEQCFGDLPEGQWVAAHAHEYGFIIRFPQGQEHITGYTFEPWHLRYVGEELSQQIYDSGKTMEEFYGFGAAPTY